MKSNTGATLLDQPESSAKDVALVESSGLATVIERLASNPQVDVAKLEKVIELQERILRINQKSAFDAAFAKMAPEIPEIDERGKIVVKSVLRSTYAPLEDIHKVVKPILATHGFAMRHRTEWPREGIIRIVGILSHESGHSEESAFEAPMDKSEYRTDVQSMGSTVSYGRRYTTLDLLNISTRKQDNDGQSAGRPQPPDGYEDWKKQLTDAAGKGSTQFDAAWECSGAEYAAFKTYMANHDRDAMNELKATARGKAARK